MKWILFIIVYGANHAFMQFVGQPFDSEKECNDYFQQYGNDSDFMTQGPMSGDEQMLGWCTKAAALLPPSAK